MRGIVGGVQVELLVVPGCPHEVAALELVRAAIEAAGVHATVTVIASAEAAQRRGFVGSPTFLIDGVDPFAVPGAPPGLTCRVYPTADGLTCVPAVEGLRDALLRA